jgi:TonB family protein
MKILSWRNYFSVFALLLVSSFNICAQESPKLPDPNEPGQGSGAGQGMGIGPGKGAGQGIGGGYGPAASRGGVGEGSGNSKAITKVLRLLAKPKANYTEEARKNGIEGVVRLRVTFSANGQVTSVSLVRGLPFGLTETAIAAARKIKFEPAEKNGVPISVSKIVEYNFNTYYKEDDKDLKKTAVVTDKPNPLYPEQAKSQKLRGTVKIAVVLTKGGTVSVVSASSDLPEIFETQAIEAAQRIKFTPAVNKNGDPVSQYKIIEYKFKPSKK